MNNINSKVKVTYIFGNINIYNFQAEVAKKNAKSFPTGFNRIFGFKEPKSHKV